MLNTTLQTVHHFYNKDGHENKIPSNLNQKLFKSQLVENEDIEDDLNKGNYSNQPY